MIRQGRLLKPTEEGSPTPVKGCEKSTTRMGAMIERIWIGKTRKVLRAVQLAEQIWTLSADHHSGPQQRMLHIEALQKTALDHTPTWSETSCITGGNHRSTLIDRQNWIAAFEKTGGRPGRPHAVRARSYPCPTRPTEIRAF